MNSYFFTVKGTLSSRMEHFLGAYASTPSDGATTVTMDVRDQTELIGLVDLISDLGLELIAFTPREDTDQPASVP